MIENPIPSKKKDAKIKAEINDKIDQISHFSHGMPHMEFIRLIEKLLELVVELSQTENQEVKADAKLAVNAIKHTIRTEVLNVKILYEKMNKQNAAKIRTDEYYNSIYMVSQQLKLDLVFLHL